MKGYYRGSGARAYDKRHERFTRITLNQALRLIDDETLRDSTLHQGRAPIILDVACGTGVLLSILHKRFPDAELYGIDGSSDMLEVARRRLSSVPHLRLEQVPLSVGDRARLPYPDRSFSLITCTNAVHAMPEPVTTLAEFRRLLAQSGQLVLEDYARRPPPFPWWLFVNLSRRFVEGYLHPYTLSEALSLCRQAGLSVTHSHAFVINWLLRGWAIRVVT